MQDIKNLLEIATHAARSAGVAILQVYLQNDFGITMKPGDTPLTKADLLSDQIISKHLAITGIPVLSEESAQIPYEVRKKWEYVWMVDPLDGTREFINRNGEFTVNIALVQHQIPVAGVIYVPVKDCMYAGSAETGIFKTDGDHTSVIKPRTKRISFDEIVMKEEVLVVASRSHNSRETTRYLESFKKVRLISMGSSLKFMMLLEDEADIYPRLGTTMEWDTAAAHAVLNAANIGVYTLDSGDEIHYNKPELKNPFFVAY